MSGSKKMITIFVRNVHPDARQDDIRKLFGKYGQVYDVTIPLDYHTGRPKGFAFVEFEDPRDAEDAIQALDRTKFYGREIELEYGRGHRKTPSEMRARDDQRGSRGGRGDRDSYRDNRDRDRSRSRDRDRDRDRSRSRDRDRRRDRDRDDRDDRRRDRDYDRRSRSK